MSWVLLYVVAWLKQANQLEYLFMCLKLAVNWNLQGSANAASAVR